MNIGYSLIDELGRTYVLKAGNPFSYNTILNKGIIWTANFHYIVPRCFAAYTKFYLKMTVSTFSWTSPPLVVAGPHTTDWGIGTGADSSFGGIDWTTYVLSQKALDKATYTNTYSDIIIQALVSNITIATGVTVTVSIAGTLPHYYIKEYDAHEDSRYSHIERLLHDGGCCFWIGEQGAFTVAPMDFSSVSGIGTNWVRNVSTSYDPSQKLTHQKIIKSSKIQTHYEFPFIEAMDAGPMAKSVSFAAPMKSVTVKDESVTGYIDVVTFFDAAAIQTAGQVGNVILLHPDDHVGTTYPVGTSAGPILAASFWVYPMKDENGNYRDDVEIDARVVFDGIPVDENPTVEDAFEVVEDISDQTREFSSQDWTVDYEYGLDEDGDPIPFTITIEEILVDGISYFNYQNIFFDTLLHAMSVVRYDTITGQAAGGYSDTVFNDPIRPADNDDYVDGIVMPNIAHANAIKKRLLYDKIKSHNQITFKGAVPLPMLPLMEAISYQGYPVSRVESVSLTGNSTTATCHPVIWW